MAWTDTRGHTRRGASPRRGGMANGVLLLSSLVFGLVHVLAVTRYEAPTRLEALLVLGVLTSIWNHGTTSVLAKWGDRVLIALCVLNDAAFVLQLPHAKERAVAGSTLALSVACYFLAKVWERVCHRTRDKLHASCHCLATIAHTFMLARLAAVQ